MYSIAARGFQVNSVAAGGAQRCRQQRSARPPPPTMHCRNIIKPATVRVADSAAPGRHVTPEMLAAAVEETCQMLSSLPSAAAADQLHSNKDQVVQSILAGADESQAQQMHWFVASNNVMNETALATIQAAVNQEAQLLKSGWTPDKCTTAVAGALVSVVLFAVSLAGLEVANSARVTRSLLRALGESTINGLRAGIHDLYVAIKAGKAVSAAKELFGLLGGLYSAGGLRVVFKEIMASLSWYDWVFSALVCVAQVIAWVASDGVAFVAECALVILSATSLMVSLEQCVEACVL